MTGSSTPLRLAFFAPLPPQPSGISDYVADLLPLLPEAWEIDVFVDAADSRDGEPGGRGDTAATRRVGGRDVGVFGHRRFEERHAAAAYDLPVYQIGNDVAHAHALPYVRRHPGLLVLHDAVLHPSRALAALADGGDLHEYARVARDCRGEVGRTLGQLVASGLAGPTLFWRFPLCEDLVRASHLTAVHGEILATWLGALVPGARITTVGHWRSVPAGDDDGLSARWRGRLGAGAGPLIGSFGHIRASHRIELIIDALAELAEHHAFTFVVAGGTDPACGLQERAAAAGLGDRTHFTGRLDEADFGALLRAVDLAVNLRYPTARASSGTLQQLLQLSVPVVVTDLIHLRDIPDGAVLRIPPGSPESERRRLVEGLAEWLRDPGARAAAAARAERFAATEITPERMRSSYVEAVREALRHRSAA